MSQMTKRALEASLKKLLLQKPLTKITISDIAEDCGMRPGAVSKALERTRTQLKAYLTERGFTL